MTQESISHFRNHKKQDGNATPGDGFHAALRIPQRWKFPLKGARKADPHKKAQPPNAENAHAETRTREYQEKLKSAFLCRKGTTAINMDDHPLGFKPAWCDSGHTEVTECTPAIGVTFSRIVDSGPAPTLAEFKVPGAGAPSRNS